MTPRQGDIWWAEKDDERRPVLVVSRTEVIPVLNRVLVAPISTTVRNIPTEIRLDDRNGLRHESAASFDNLQPVLRSLFAERIGRMEDGAHAICAALAAVADC